MLIVACDFDDTIVIGSLSTAIQEAFSSENWEQIEEEHLSGMHSLEESFIRQYALIKGVTKKDIEEFVLGEVVIRYALDEFLDYCHGEGIRLVIVSSGLDIYISPIMELVAFGEIEIYAGKAEVTPDGINIDYTDPSGTPVTAGFKESYIRHFRDQGHTVVYIGGGPSDIGPAREADYVVARSTLAEYLEANSLPFYPFDTFGEVGKAIQEIREGMENEEAK